MSGGLDRLKKGLKLWGNDLRIYGLSPWCHETLEM